MTDQDNLRDRIAAQITPFLYWNYADWEDADERDKADARECAQEIIDELGLTVVEAPGGISDYSPFTGKPVVQPDKWWVEGERVFTREKQ